jgi:hypothetical protein
MGWKYRSNMKISKFVKIIFFIIATSVFFTSCANKSINKNTKIVDKQKIKTINQVLNDSFEYDANQRLYKHKSIKAEDTNNLLSKIGQICSEKKGKIVYISYYINKNYVNSYTNNKAYICEINNEPYFISHHASQNSSSYSSISIDKHTKKAYLNYKKRTRIDSRFNSTFEAAEPSEENTENSIREKQEIQKREKAREQKTKLLFNKKNQRTMTFYNSWRYTEKEALCSKKCTNINKRTTGYSTLKEANNNNWQLISKIGEIEEAIDLNCTCIGYSVLLKKLANVESIK